MSADDVIFSFDVGKASLGICVRQGEHILDLKSLLIPAEFAATVDFRNRRRAYRTRQAHKKREEWLLSTWEKSGLSSLSRDDERLKREFPKKGDETIYNSALLRIALLQERPLVEWQIFKALWAAIQLRGYETVAWSGNAKKNKVQDASLEIDGVDVGDLGEADKQKLKEEKENQENAEKYKTYLHYAISPHFQYEYPCFLEASRMGLWSSETPEVLKLRIDHTAKKVRRKAGHDSAEDAGNTAPRWLVEKEIRQLLENAKKQLPALRQIDTNEFLYGPAQKPYASYEDPTYYRYRGTEWDAQGVLTQKIPRFDNRILNKCQMLPKRNVCKANDPLSLQFNLLMKIKNIRFTDENGEVGQFLSPQELKMVYELCQKNLAEKKTADITFGNLVRFIKTVTGKTVQDINLAKGEKIRLNASGRSRFCRPALTIMNQILLEGIDPPDFDVSPYVQESSANGITREELDALIGRFGKTWQGFHVGDKRYLRQSEEREIVILELIGSSNNPIVRHRLTFFWQELRKLAQAYSKPGRVILEFARGGEGLDGQKTSNDWEREIKNNEKTNDRIRGQLEEQGLKSYQWNIERFKLAEEQQWQCPYTGERLHAGMLEYYQVDHIVPRSGDIVTDAFYNKVLCTQAANQDKRNRTPYEWLYDTEQWPLFLARVTDKNSSYSKKKKELLIRKDARELVESYNGLAETAYIARLAQQIVALEFDWGLQTKNDERRVFVNDGKITSKIRRVYGLNELLLTDDECSKLAEARDAGQQRAVWKKNRENPKHHALDAYCISYSQELKIHQVDDAGRVHWYVPGIEASKAELERKLLELFPTPTRRNTKELYPLETIYGYRKRMENGHEIHYLTVRKSLIGLLEKDRKKIKDIYDLDIRQDLSVRSEEIKDNKEWLDFLKSYQHPTRKGRVNAILIIESRSEKPLPVDESGRMLFGEYRDFGNLDTKGGQKGVTRKQFKHSKANKGQIIYNPGKGWKVQQVYVHEKTARVKQHLRSSGFVLYNDGQLFYPGCQIFVPVAFKAGKYELPGGIYKSRTIKAAGQVIIEDNNGEEFQTNIKYLVDAGFKLVEYHDRTVTVLSPSSIE